MSTVQNRTVPIIALASPRRGYTEKPTAKAVFITLFLSFIFSYQFHMSYFHFHKNHIVIGNNSTNNARFNDT